MVNVYLFGASGHGKVVKDILNVNGVKVEAFVDDNPRVDECLNIGKGCMIGAGSVVVKDIPDGVTAYGNPCRVKTKINKDNNMSNSNLTHLNRGDKTRVKVWKSYSLEAERRMSHAA